MIHCHFTKTIGWIRVFGVGIAYKDTRKHQLLFGERNGYTKTLQIGAWSFKWLPRVTF